MNNVREVRFPGAVSFGHTLAPLRRGPRDPCFRLPGDGTIWRTSLLPTGPVTALISRAAADVVVTTQARAAELREQIAKLQSMLDAL